MKKLIVDTNNAPFTSISTILATWAKLAEMIDKEVTLPRGCYLAWQLPLTNTRHLESYEAYASAQVVFSAVAYSNSQSVEVVLTRVDDVAIYDEGTFSWHGDAKRMEDESEVVSEIATALSRGRSADGRHHYRVGWLPSLGQEGLGK